MGLKKPSDYFKRESNNIKNMVGNPNLNSYSESFNTFKENLSKFEKITETIEVVNQLKEELQNFLKKEDLDNAMLSYVFLLEESIENLQSNVKSINSKTLAEIKSKVSNVTDVVNEFIEVDIPKYKKNIVDVEVKTDQKFIEFKEEFDNVISQLSDDIDKKQFEISNNSENNLNEAVSNLENHIKDIDDSNKSISNTLKVKVNEIQKLKKKVVEELKVNKTINETLKEKVENLQIELIRGENNLKEQNINFQKIENGFKDTIEKLNVPELEKENFVLSTKIKHLEEVYEKLKEESKINETLIEQTLPSTETSDPLTPLDQNYVTLDQLQQHYRLFLGRIQTQLSTLGGGGETRLQYLDDIVGIATNLSEYDGKFLKVDTSQPAGKNFVFETVSGGGGGGSVVGISTTGGSFFNQLNVSGVSTFSNDINVTGISSFKNIINSGVTSVGIVTALPGGLAPVYFGDGSNLQNINATNINNGSLPEGVLPASLTSLNVTGDVSIGGTLTYEDVTNIDSVGLITARSGIEFGVAGAGGTIRANGDTTLAGVVTASSFVGDLTGTATSITVTANNSGGGPVYPVFVSGSATGSQGAETDTNLSYNTNSNELTVGSISANYVNITLDINANGNIIGDNATNISGINSVTAVKFFGDGSELTSVNAITLGSVSSGDFLRSNTDDAMTATFTSYDIKPASDFSITGYDLGTPTKRYENIYVRNVVGTASSISGISSVGTAITMYGSSGIVSATKFFGDGSELTGISAGFSPDADENLVAGTNAGANLDGSSGCHNVLLGLNAGCALTSGHTNIAFGCKAGPSSGTSSNGVDNITIGRCAGYEITGGSHNVFLGCAVAANGTMSGMGNVFLGARAGNVSAAADYNIFVGFCAGNTNTSGSKNIAIGYDVELPSETANCQLAIGQGTSRWITGDSSFNVTLAGIATISSATGIVSATKFCGDGSALTGISAGFSADSRCNLFAGFGSGVTAGVGTDKNIVMGFCSGYNLNGAVGNIFMGCYIGVNASGNYNIAFGRMSGLCLTTGSSNILMGVGSGFQMTTGQRNIAMGTGNLEDATGSDYNIAIGFENAKVNDVTGEQNVFIGQQNARRITSGCCNTVIGQCNADCLSTANCNVLIGRKVVATGVFTGNDNVFLGQYVASIATSADYNVMLGHCTGKNLTSGTHNIALGQDAMGAGTITGTHNIAMGNKAGNCIASGSYNIFFGRYAGSTNYGTRNVAIGCMAGMHASGGQNDNVFVGTYAGCCAKSYRNIALGYQALKKSTSGGCNVIIGDTAACAVTSGCFNLVSGFKAGLSISSGSCNIFLGKCAGNTTTTGDRNIAIGHDVELSTATGSNQLGIGSGTDLWIEGDSSYNVTLSGIATVYSATGIVSATKFCGDGSALTGISAGGFSPDDDLNLVAGTNAGKCLDGSSGCFNVFVGECAGKCTTSGDSNIFLGKYAGCKNTTGNCNIAIGMNAGKGDSVTAISGYNNVSLGFCAGAALCTGSDNYFIGFNAGGIRKSTGVTGCYNIAFGCLAGACLQSGEGNTFIGGIGVASGDCISGDYNTSIGGCTLQKLTSGEQNVVIGWRSGYCVCTGSENVLIGHKAGCSLTTGQGNVLIGAETQYQSGGNNWFNVFIGKQAGSTSCGGCNVFLGYQAAKNRTTGQHNVAIGRCAFKGSGSATGGCNAVFGVCAGHKIDSGNFNTLLGPNAGMGITTGSCNVVVGYGATVTTTTGNHQLAIGIGNSNWISGDSSFNVSLSGQVNLNGMSKESINIVANKLSAATDINLEDGLVHYFSTTETADATPNIRFNSSTTLNSKLSVGDSVTVTIISSTDNTNYSYEQLTIDGSAVTEQWIGGAAPSGGSSGYDIYTFQIIKTADATYLVFGNKVNFT